MRLYYFTPPDHALENIEKRHLKMSFADEVNDVFEHRPFDFGKRKYRLLWNKHIKQQAKKYGFICFAEHWDSPVMWAHYAHNHKGVCYGFEIDEELVTQIRYVEHLRHFSPAEKLDPSTVAQNLSYSLETKASPWSYEREWRMQTKLSERDCARKASKKQTIFFEKFSTDFALKEVIIGMNSNINSKQIKKVLLEEDKVIVRTARPSFRRYAMVEQKRPSLQK
ncbi:DUF2971 domain-containing protein [Roseibium aggregatum]|uniref:DUF2971 domain-containing protein n=1 Tax=Roseibium aggregatum TaxID=187304 RepID=UPI003A971E1C